MRTLKIIEHISLDGVIQVSGEDGDFPYARCDFVMIRLQFNVGVRWTSIPIRVAQ